MVFFNQCYILKNNNTASKRIAIETHGKKMILNSINEERVHYFHVVYMTHPVEKKNGTHRDQVIKTFEQSFKPVTVYSISNNLTKSNVSVISLMVFYENSETMIYIDLLRLWFILPLIIHFLLIIWFSFKISYPNSKILLKIPSSIISLGK